MDDQRDYAEEAAVRRDLALEGEQELVAERDQQLIAAIRNTIKGGRLAGGSSSAILGQVESLLAGVETFLAAAPVVGDVDNVRRETEDGDPDAEVPAGVEGLAHQRGGDWHTQPSGEQPIVKQRKAGA